MDRNYITAELKDRTILIDTAKHFPTYRDYEVERLADSLARTSTVDPNSVGIITLHV